MLTLADICYKYAGSDQKVLDKVTAEFTNGKTHAIMGPSGSGKTTLLSILSGLDRPTEGEILLEGEPLSKLDLNEYRRSRCSMIFQAFNLFPLLSAVENVCMPMQINGAAFSDSVPKAQSYLTLVGIDEPKYGRYPANLSGGEQQRVAIARALASGAKVLLADEPTGNLDEDNAEIVVNLLKNLAHEHDYCVIVVTHNSDISEVLDVQFRMRHGRLEARG